MPFTRIKIEKGDRIYCLYVCVTDSRVYICLCMECTQLQEQKPAESRAVTGVMWSMSGVQREELESTVYGPTVCHVFCLIASLRPRTQIYLVRFMLTQSTHLSDCQDLGPMIWSCCICTCIRMVRFSQFKTILIL